MLKQRIEQDLKTALLAGDKFRATVLRGLKSVILYAEVEKGVRETGLSDEEITVLLAKEAKKRQESADLYQQGGDKQRADSELAEKELIEAYLPEQLTDEDLTAIIDELIHGLDDRSPQVMGKVIGQVKQQVGSQADGGRIASLVKQRLIQK